MQSPKFTIADIRYADSPATFKRAQDLYQSGKVTGISENPYGYSAIVQGTQQYEVNVSYKRIDDGDCTCYLGEHDRLCKHILALGLAVLHDAGVLDDVKSVPGTPADLKTAKQIVSDGMRKLRPYTGPSRVWFSYQRALTTGSGMIMQGIGELQPTKENAIYLWSVVKRIDRKLLNGIDDSDGVVGDCTARIIEQLASYAEAIPELLPVIKRCCVTTKTNFNFEDELRARIANM